MNTLRVASALRVLQEKLEPLGIFPVGEILSVKTHHHAQKTNTSRAASAKRAMLVMNAPRGMILVGEILRANSQKSIYFNT
jgi:hypothetical protein